MRFLSLKLPSAEIMSTTVTYQVATAASTCQRSTFHYICADIEQGFWHDKGSLWKPAGERTGLSYTAAEEKETVLETLGQWRVNEDDTEFENIFAAASKLYAKVEDIPGIEFPKPRLAGRQRNRNCNCNIVIYLLTLHILILLRIDSEERMVFLGGHPAKYWSPTNVRAVRVCACVCVCTALSGIYYSGSSW